MRVRRGVVVVFALLGVLGVLVAFGPAACRRPQFPRQPYHEPKASEAVDRTAGNERGEARPTPSQPPAP